MKKIIEEIKENALLLGIPFLLVYSLVNKTVILEFLSTCVNVLLPFILGIFIAYLLNPCIVLVEKKLPIQRDRVKRSISIIITYIIFLIVLIGIGFVCIPQLIDSITELINQIPTMHKSTITYLNSLNAPALKDFVNWIIPTINKFSEALTTMLPTVLNWSVEILRSCLSFLIAIVLSIYISFDKEHIFKSMNRCGLAFLGKKKTEAIANTFKESEDIFHKFIIGKAIDSLIIGLLCSIIMYLCHLQYIGIISLLVGITNMIPYFGPFIGGAIGTVLLFIISPKSALIFLIIVFLLQQFDGYILGPKILGGKIGIRPLWIIISVLIGGAVGGFIGMFLGTPILAIITNLINKMIDKKLKENLD